MKTKDRNKESYFAIIDSFLKQAELREREYNLLSSELKRYLNDKFENGKYYHPMITKFCTDWYREFYRLIGFKDPYKTLKMKSNEEAKKILSSLNINNFLNAIKVSVIGNKLDFGAVLVVNPDLNKLYEDFHEVDNLEFAIDDTLALKKAIKNSKKILYLPDNAGEVIFDIPLLDYIKSLNKELYLGAKDSPMLNDITIDELQKLNFDRFGKIVSIGSNCFGLHEEDTSIEFKRTLKNCDLIIAKGQAYLEFFTEYNFENVFNLVRIKYPIVNEILGTLESGQNVVISSKRYAKAGISYKYGTLHSKIIERNKIGELAEKLRNQNNIIVTINGSFDILHLGHIKLLEEAKKQGDILIVGLNSDYSIKQYKSPFRPINSQQERAEFLVALSCVDYVFIFNETEPIKFLEEIRPNVHCNASDYGLNCIEAPTVKRYGGRIHIFPLIEGYSTTKLIEKILEAKENESKNK